MSNFTHEYNTTTYTEPVDTEFYHSEVLLAPEFEEDESKVGLCLKVEGNGKSVVLGIETMEDVQEFLYMAAVRSNLIKEGEPLILMKRVQVK